MAKQWTPKDEKYLIKSYGKVPNAELAEHFGVTVKSVINKMSSLRKAGVTTEKKEVKPKPKPAALKKPEVITPLSQITKKRPPKAAKAKKTVKKVEVEDLPELVPTSIMILTEEGWKPINIDKRKIKS